MSLMLPPAAQMDDRLSSDLASLRIDRGSRPPASSSGRGVRWIATLAIAAAVAVVVWRVALPMAEAKLFKTEVAVTEIALVSPAEAQVQLTSTGYAVPQVAVDVSSKLVGRVDKANVREGTQVKAGQIVFELDANDQRVLVASARARVRGACAGRNRAGAARRDRAAARSGAEARRDGRNRPVDGRRFGCACEVA